jgi:hypothetical protein
VSESKPADSKSVMVSKRLYGSGRIDVAADGPPEFTEAIKRALDGNPVIQPVLRPDRFLADLLSGGVPETIAREIVVSLRLEDDESYFSRK